jgi:hypothetical protein
VDEIDNIVKEKRRWRRSDDGFISIPIIRDVAILIVVLATVWAAFSAQKASNDSERANDRLSRVTLCTSEFTARTIRALNQRTTDVQNRADANLELQKSQATFFTLLLKQPPKPETVRREAAQRYLQALTDFVEASVTANKNSVSTPYPTNEEFNDCLNREQ